MLILYFSIVIVPTSIFVILVILNFYLFYLTCKVSTLHAVSVQVESMVNMQFVAK